MPRTRRDSTLPNPPNNPDYPSGTRIIPQSRRDAAQRPAGSDEAPMGYDGAYDLATRPVNPDLEHQYARDVESGVLPRHADRDGEETNEDGELPPGDDDRRTEGSQQSGPSRRSNNESRRSRR